MLIKGEKYACEACVRGHRVSSCTHSERKLLHVNKKGRPVSQCHHCRSLRKARSQHVKCECQDKSHAKEDCPHLKDLPVTETNTCCCGHGARCTCSLKKENSLDPVPEDVAQLVQPIKDVAKPRLSSMNSHDSKATVFSNGHHKPVHKFNDAHNHCGAPYRVPTKSHSLQSHSLQSHRELAQRSSDSLPLPSRGSTHHESPLHNVTNAPQLERQVKSEHNSPMMNSLTTTAPPFDVVIPPLSPNAYSYSPFDAQSPTVQQAPQPDYHIPENIPDSWFTTLDEIHDYPSGPGCKNPLDMGSVDWASLGLGGGIDTNNQSNIYGMGQNRFAPSQQQMYGSSFDHMNHLNQQALTSSSGEISEAEDSSGTYRPSNLRTISHASNDISSQGGDDASENYRLSSTSSYLGTPSANVLAGNLEDLDIDKFIAEQNQMNMQMSQSQTPERALSQPQSQRQAPSGQTPPQSQPRQASNASAQSFFSTNQYNVEHPFTIHEAQAYAHMGNAGSDALAQQKPSMPTTTSGEDPMWCVGSDENSAFKLDDEREDEAWVR